MKNKFASENAKLFSALVICGFALIGTWSNILGYSPTLLSPEVGGGFATSTWFSAGRLVAAVVFVVFAVVMQKHMRWLGLLAGVVLAPLTLIMCLAARQGGSAASMLGSDILVPLCAFVGSIGFLVISVPLAVRLIKTLGSRPSALCVVTGILGECLLSSLVNASGSFGLQLAVCTVAPLLGGVCLYAVETIGPVVSRVDNEGEGLPSGGLRTEMHGTQDAFGTVLMLVQLSLVMILSSLLRSMSGMGPWGRFREGYLGASSLDAGLLLFICVFVGGVSLVIFVLLDRFPSQCRYALAIVVVLLGMQSAQMDFQGAAVITLSCQIFSRILIKITFMECVRQLRIPPLRINGIAAFFNVAGSMLFASATAIGMSVSDFASNVVYLLLSVTVVAVTLPYMDKEGLRSRAIGAESVAGANGANSGMPPGGADDRSGSLEGSPGGDSDEACDEESDDAIRLFAASKGLSAREEEVFALLLDGCTRGQIERLLGLSEGTVRTHVNAVYRKVDVHSKAEMQQAFADWEQVRK